MDVLGGVVGQMLVIIFEHVVQIGFAGALLLGLLRLVHEDLVLRFSLDEGRIGEKLKNALDVGQPPHVVVIIGLGQEAQLVEEGFGAGKTFSLGHVRVTVLLLLVRLHQVIILRVHL